VKTVWFDELLTYTIRSSAHRNGQVRADKVQRVIVYNIDKQTGSIKCAKYPSFIRIGFSMGTRLHAVSDKTPIAAKWHILWHIIWRTVLFMLMMYKGDCTNLYLASSHAVYSRSQLHSSQGVCVMLSCRWHVSDHRSVARQGTQTLL
jgi:hypothetical protein